MIDEIQQRTTKVILGLGNPGKRYASTRHNYGFMVVDRIAFLKKEEFIAGPAHFDYCRILSGENEIYLCKPTTFMNLSGRAAQGIIDFLDVSPEELLVVCDDCNLPQGRLRYRITGSDGGHNGLASIIERLQTGRFSRLRLGIGMTPDELPLEDYVLEDFPRDESDTIEDVVSTASKFALNIAVGKIENKSITISVIDQE